MASAAVRCPTPTNSKAVNRSFESVAASAAIHRARVEQLLADVINR
jgi:hypothetical protein